MKIPMTCLDCVRNAVFSFTVFSFCFRNDAIVPFFKIIEEDRNIGQMVIDYSISQTTLEEVFLNVSRVCVCVCVCVGGGGGGTLKYSLM